MDGFKGYFRRIIALSVTVLAISIMPVYGQVTTACTSSMISSITPCINFITGSTGNGSSPTSGCCSSLQSLLSGSSDCACLIITGNVPFQLPINRTLAISLPSACNMGGVPIQCKASGTPLPSPGPVSLGPAPSTSSLSPSPKASSVPETSSPTQAPESDTTLALSPASPPVEQETPTAVPGLRPVLTPSSAARLSQISSPPLLFVLGIMVLKYY